VGDKLIAFLQTGQILIHRPDRAQFNKIAQQLIEWGAQVDLKRVEETFFNTRVLTKQQYDSLIRLLTIFAEHLASCGNALMLAHGQTETPAIDRARRHIHDHSSDELSLGAVADVVNMSASYFSEKFKQAAGMNFVEYVARTRIEKARNLLQNPNLRISEIAFDVGFQSLSQFNRAFKKVTGKAPSKYRQSLAG
jgi:AraC-like DNA-binding protein